MPIDSADLENRFGFHPATPENGHGQQHDNIRAQFLAFAVHMSNVLPDGREQSLVITKLEEAMFWANAAIARN